ncbi:hypothetical protein F8388_025512 [Cannabis sativa]|uniref:DUF4283 domain-containing protein n=1 Tax=Cannabis sativa TaxID=3483 RepID=A0A7J6G0X0_CANSA|nr:hypothetical protein F8388_025512 [Cannabis sativa]
MHSRGVHGPSGHGRHQNPTGFGKKHGHYPTGFGWKNYHGLSVAKKLQKYWSFQTKHKVFMVTLTYDGGAVRICERTRLFGYEVTVTIDAADWIIDTLEEIQQKPGAQRVNLKRSFRNSVASCLLECYANNKGSFLKISVLKDNKLKTIIVPEEEGAKGWLELKECLSGIVKRRVTVTSDRSSSQREEQKARESTTIQSWANIVKQAVKPAAKPGRSSHHNQGSAKAIPLSRDEGIIEWKDLYPEINPGFKPKNHYPLKRFKQPKFFEYMRSKALPRDWSLAIILTRDNTHADWCTIFYNLSRELKRKWVVSQLYDDKCIIWCKNEMERDELTKIRRMRVPGAQSFVTFLSWSWENQKDNPKVECRGSWIGVQGLPLHLWNMRIFRKIGDLCGGLLDVDKDTAEACVLSHLRLQLMGDTFGFVPESVTLCHDNMSFELKLFKLNDLSYRFHGSFNTCWYQDFDHGRMAGDEEGLGKEGRIDETNERDGTEEGVTTTVAAEKGKKKNDDLEEVINKGEEQSRELGPSEMVSPVPERVSIVGDRAAEVVEEQFTAQSPKQTLMSTVGDAAIEDESRLSCLESREFTFPKSHDQRNVVSLYLIFNRLWKSLWEPRVCKNPNDNMVIIYGEKYHPFFKKSSLLGLGVVGRTDIAPVMSLGQYNHGQGVNVFNSERRSGREVLPWSGPAFVIHLGGLRYLRKGPFNIILDRKNDDPQGFLKKRQALNNFTGTRQELNALYRKKNPQQILHDFFQGRLRSIHPKAREQFKRAIISFWEEVVMEKREARDSVLQVEEKVEPEKKFRPEIKKVYNRKRKADVNESIYHYSDENLQLELEEFFDDPKEIEFLDGSSEEEDSEGEEVTDQEDIEEQDDIVCNIKELWNGREEDFSSQPLEKEKLSIDNKITNVALSWSKIVDSMAEMGMEVTQKNEEDDQKSEELNKDVKLLVQMYGVPAHDPHQNCRFLDHDDTYYEGEAGQFLHLQLIPVIPYRIEEHDTIVIAT